jgi:ribosomal protein S18 acetylase RimI-like enzyme
MTAAPDYAARARAWLENLREEFCDVIEPWEHGTVARATTMPDYWDFNAVELREATDLDALELARFADSALEGLAHRKIEVYVPEVAAALRPGFEALGWKVGLLVWMRFGGPLPPGPEIAVEEVPYDAVDGLRRAWHAEDFPGLDPSEYLQQLRGVALRRGSVVYAAVEDGEPVAFAELERRDGGAEIASVYVSPEYRGDGRGTAITRAAIEAGRDAEDLWIIANAEGRPRDLYARLGFTPVWESSEFLLPPPG